MVELEGWSRQRCFRSRSLSLAFYSIFVGRLPQLVMVKKVYYWLGEVSHDKPYVLDTGINKYGVIHEKVLYTLHLR